MDSLSVLVGAMEQARALTAVVCSPEEERVAQAELASWAANWHVEASMFRTVNEHGRLGWYVEVDAGRGTIGGTVKHPAMWYEPIGDAGLWPTPTTST